MRVLLTGTFGQVGEATLIALTQLGHDVVCLEPQTRANKARQRRLGKLGSFRMVWGDITDQSTIGLALQGVEVIIHLAAAIPTCTTQLLALGERINVLGTVSLISFAESLRPSPHFILASSTAIHGPRGPSVLAEVSVNSSLMATDNFSRQNIECERMLRSSHLQWTILRLGAVAPLEAQSHMQQAAFMFKVPPEGRVEYVHARDAGVAFANAVEARSVGSTFLIGGGQCWQTTHGIFNDKRFEAFGIGALPREAFCHLPSKDEEWFNTDWMDTRESQRVLQYQSMSFDAYIMEMRANIGVFRSLVVLLQPLIRFCLLLLSPCYRSFLSQHLLRGPGELFLDLNKDED